MKMRCDGHQIQKRNFEHREEEEDDNYCLGRLPRGVRGHAAAGGASGTSTVQE